MHRSVHEWNLFFFFALLLSSFSSTPKEIVTHRVKSKKKNLFTILPLFAKHLGMKKVPPFPRPEN